ncbi:MAG: DUF2599 domain-containing protein [Brevundimonas sp.]
MPKSRTLPAKLAAGRTALATGALAVAVTALLVGCTARGAEPGPDLSPPAASSTTALPSGSSSPTSQAPTSAAATSAAPTSAAPPSAATVRESGTKIRSAGATIHVLPAADVELTKKVARDGSVHLHLTASTAPVDEPVAYIAGTGAKALADGTALAGHGGLSPDGGSLRPSSKGVLALYARTAGTAASVWFAGTAVDDTDWGVREGGRSLAVTPSTWARGGGLAAADLTWTQLVEREPDADSASMHDQLRCHELGAPDKATWNLEPWRPQVDGLAMLAARCNPT